MHAFAHTHAHTHFYSCYQNETKPSLPYVLFSVSVCVPLETFLKQKEINRERERQLSLTRKKWEKRKRGEERRWRK